MALQKNWTVGLIRSPNVIAVEGGPVARHRAMKFLEHPTKEFKVYLQPTDLFIAYPDKDTGCFSYFDENMKLKAGFNPLLRLSSAAVIYEPDALGLSMNRNQFINYGQAWNTFWLTEQSLAARIFILKQLQFSIQDMSEALFRAINKLYSVPDHEIVITPEYRISNAANDLYRWNHKIIDMSAWQRPAICIIKANQSFSGGDFGSEIMSLCIYLAGEQARMCELLQEQIPLWRLMDKIVTRSRGPARS